MTTYTGIYFLDKERPPDPCRRLNKGHQGPCSCAYNECKQAEQQMKIKIVPSSELTPKNLTAHYYIPDAFYYTDKRITFTVRETNNVLGEEDWPKISITLLEERIVRLNVLHMGAVAIPNFKLWDGIKVVLEWLAYDGTGHHPEVTREIYDPVERDWKWVSDMETLIVILAKCYRQGRHFGYQRTR